MDKLIELLIKNPILLFVLLAWVAGAIGQQLKKKGGGDGKRTPAGRRSSRRKAKAERGPEVQQPVAQQQQAPVAQKAPKSAGGPLAGSTAQTPDQIAREMRRILGLEQQPPAPAKSPAPPPPPPPITRPPIERPPEPIYVSTSERTLESHVDPHVGERIRDRHLRESQVGKPRAGRGKLGGLGGRVESRKRVASAGSRYSLDDLRKAIVINEILSPPVSVRSHEDRRPG